MESYMKYLSNETLKYIYNDQLENERDKYKRQNSYIMQRVMDKTVCLQQYYLI